jgi:hypothetical protein
LHAWPAVASAFGPQETLSRAAADVDVSLPPLSRGEVGLLRSWAALARRRPLFADYCVPDRWGVALAAVWLLGLGLCCSCSAGAFVVAVLGRGPAAWEAAARGGPPPRPPRRVMTFARLLRNPAGPPPAAAAATQATRPHADVEAEARALAADPGFQSAFTAHLLLLHSWCGRCGHGTTSA